MKYIIIPIIVSIMSQILKIIIETIKYQKFNIIRLFNGMGGMPSTHSALVSSLSTLIYLDYGYNSSLFAITLFFSLIVIYDAMGVRYESEKHAILLNKITNANLKEKIGHKTIEIIIGILFGIIFTLIIK